ncbi:hypothetical protein N0V83_007391 [Neocucurbitaria cava]|uniref:Uncharacterized protein n=1 Tax=Neocucurbitaria cava TaxID=798079 RepID=A0A9W9CKC7_9PLEO|nr:hypothetical protein N0V83_007391 [Neocucurbitaria cava]
MHRFRDSQPEFEMLTPPSLPAAKCSTPQIPKLAKAFVDSLNAQQLSNFLTWMLYYDLVELPESPRKWYEMINSMEMRGWLALGDFLSQITGTGYGFDLIVLDSICDRINLRRASVHGLIIHFADPKNMAFTQIAATINTATEDGKSKLETLEAVQAKLHSLYQLATNLKPTEGSTYHVWHAVIVKRLRGFLHLVIGPRIAHVRLGAPLITASTCENLPKEKQDGVKLSYMYEALQQKRQVPLERYGIHPSTPTRVYLTPQSPPMHAVSALDDAELARSHAIHLMKLNQVLYAQVAKLTRENEDLTEANDKLELTVATLRGIQQADDSQLNTPNNPPSSPPYKQDSNTSTFLRIPPTRTRPRSLSHNAGEKLAAELDAKINISKRSHKRQQSEVLSWKYQVFSGLEGKPLPTLRLSDPVTGELIPPPPSRAPPPIPRVEVSRPVSYAEKRSRRSGMIFDSQVIAGRLNFGGTTSRVYESDDEGDGVEVATPTPVARKRLTYE